MTKQTEVVLGEAFAAPPSRLAHEAVVTEDGPHPAVQLEPLRPGASAAVLAGRATRVP